MFAGFFKGRWCRCGIPQPCRKPTDHQRPVQNRHSAGQGAGDDHHCLRGFRRRGLGTGPAWSGHLLAEPTDLIGTGQGVAGDDYIPAVSKIRAIDENIGIMIASGITTAEDVYNVVRLGADGTGGTSGILSAPDPVIRIREMAEAILQAEKDRKTEGEA